MSNSAFEQWYDGMVGFHLNSERILYDINFAVDYGYVNPETVRKWMKVCWNAADLIWATRPVNLFAGGGRVTSVPPAIASISATRSNRLWLRLC